MNNSNSDKKSLKRSNASSWKSGSWQPSVKKAKSKKTWQYGKDAQRNIVHVTRRPSPSQAFVKLKVTGFFTSTFGASDYNLVGTVASMNNIIATSGLWAQEPTGLNQWATFFQRFTVLASKCKLSIANGLNSNACPLAFTLIPSTMTQTQMQAAADHGSTANAGTYCDLMNDRFAKTVHIFGVNSAWCANMDLKQYIKIKTLYPDKDIIDDPDFTGTHASFN